MGGRRRALHRDRLYARARAHAGLHRRARDRRPRRDARCDGRARRRPRAHQPAGAGRARDRPLDPGRRLQRALCLPAERRARVRAKRRALRLPALGPERVRQLQRRSAEHRDLPPGQPRVPGPRGRDARRAGLPRHARRNRLAHHDDQRPRSARLGGGRHRGRGGDARPARLDAGPAGRRLPADRRAARGLHGDRPRAHGHPDPSRARGRRQVRGVLRARPREAAARRPRHDREHGARVRRHLRDLPGGRRDAPLPGVLRAPGRAGRAGGGLLPRAGPLPRRGRRGRGLFGHARARARHRRAEPGGPQAAAGPRGAHRRRPRLRGGAGGNGGRRRPRAGHPRRRCRRVVSGERSALAGGRGERRRAAHGAGAGRRGHRNGRTRRGARPRSGRDRRDHELHQHLEPERDDRRRPAREEGPRGGADAQAVGQDVAGARIEGGDRVPRARRPAGAVVAARLRPGRATAAPPASATPGRCRRRSRGR